MYNIPILFIIFRRKDIALQSFERFKQVKQASYTLLVMAHVKMLKEKPN